MKQLIELLENCYKENGLWGVTKAKMSYFERFFIRSLEYLFDKDQLDEELKQGLIEDFKSSDTIEDFIRSNSVTKLINYLFKEKNIMSSDDYYNDKTFYGDKNDVRFIQVFSRIEDMDYKRSFLKKSPSVAYSILAYGREEDGLFPECFKQIVLDGTLENLRMLPQNFKFIFDYSHEEIEEMFNYYFSRIDERSTIHLERLFKFLGIESKYDYVSLALKMLPKIESERDNINENLYSNQNSFIKEIVKSFSEEEIGEYKKRVQGQDLKVLLEYAIGEIKKEEMDLVLLDYYKGDCDVEKLKEQLLLTGSSIDDFDGDKNEIIKSIFTELQKQRINILEKLVEHKKLSYYPRSRFHSASIKDFLSSLDKDAIDLFELLFSNIQDKKKEAGYTEIVLDTLIHFAEKPTAENILNLLNLDNLFFLYNEHGENGGVCPAQVVIEDYVKANGRIEGDESTLKQLLLELVSNNCYDKLLRCFSTKSISQYINNTNKKDGYDKAIFSRIIGFLTKDEFESLEIDNYKRAELLIRCENVEYSEMIKAFKCIDDDFLQVLISRSCTPNELSRMGKDEAVLALQEYKRIKEEYEELVTDEEKSNFLINIYKDYDSEEQKEIISLMSPHLNLLKKSLMKNISNHDCRMAVINSMQNTVGSDMQESVTIAQKALREFFESRGALSPEKEEIMEMVFNSFDAYVGIDNYFERANTTGKCSYIPQMIVMRESRIGTLPISILELIHEYVHAFSNRDYNEKHNHFGFDIEEGLADTIAEIAFNEYMQKHRNISISGNEYTYSDYVETKSTYYESNIIFKTILYGLEGKGIDRDVLIETCLGDKLFLLEAIFGKDKIESIIDRFQCTDGTIDLKISPEDVCELLGDNIKRRNEQDDHNSSPYLHRNNAIPMVGYLMDRMECKEVPPEGCGWSTSVEELKERMENSSITLENIMTATKKRRYPPEP